MSLPYKQFIYPLVPSDNKTMYIGLRINKGILGYDPVTSGKIADIERIYLSDVFTIENLGDFERTKHDIDANPVVPKIEITIGDFFFISGKVNGVPVNFSLASFLDELFDDPTIVYEVWLDRWSNDAATLEEVWFCGDIDYNTIPAQHRYGALDVFSASAQYPLKLYTLTANFATERLSANVDHTYNQNGVNWVPGSIMDFAYNYPASRDAIWTSTTHREDDHAIYCGSVAPFPYSSDFGQTGPAHSGLVRGYGFPPNSVLNPGENYFPVTSPNMRTLCVERLCEIIALYGQFDSASLDANMMFDLYGQMIDNAATPTNWPLQLVAGPGPSGSGTNTWHDIFVNANFLFGNGITIANSWTGTGINLTGTSGHGGTYDIHLQGSFFDYLSGGGGAGIAYFGGNINTGVLTITQCSDGTYAHALGDGGAGDVTYGGQFPIEFTGPIVGTNVTLSGAFANSTVNMHGTVSGGTVSLTGSGPLLYNWPCTIPMNNNVMSLALWIAIQTGTWVDTAIDTSGNVTMTWRARRTLLPSAGGPAFFTGANLAPNNNGLLSSEAGAKDVAKTSLTVQCQGDDLLMMAGPDKNNANAITLPWRCHKFGSPTSISSDTIFFNPNGDISFTNEQWWDRGKKWEDQWQCITVDAKVADGPSQIGLNDDKYTARAGVAIPTAQGWVGAALLLWPNSSGNFAMPSGEFLGNTTHQTSNNAMIGVAAILPAGLTLPTDEMCGGYFDPQKAYAQFYYQDMVGNKEVLTEEYAGILGDDGTIQGLRPGLLRQTFYKGKLRVFESHNVKQNPKEGTTTIQWREVPIDGGGNVNYNNLLPEVVAISGNGTQSSSSASSSSSSGGGTATSITLTSQYPATVNTVEVYSNNILGDSFTASILAYYDSTKQALIAQRGWRPLYGAGAHDSGYSVEFELAYKGNEHGNCYVSGISPIVAGVKTLDYWYTEISVRKTDVLDNNLNVYYWPKHRAWSEDSNTYLNHNILGCTHPNRRVFVKGRFSMSWAGAGGFGLATWATMADPLIPMSDRELLSARRTAPFTASGFDVVYLSSVNPIVTPAGTDGIQVNFGERMFPVAIDSQAWKINLGTPTKTGSYYLFPEPVENGRDNAGANISSILLKFGLLNFGGAAGPPPSYVINYANNAALNTAFTENAGGWSIVVDLWGLCEIKGEDATTS